MYKCGGAASRVESGEERQCDRWPETRHFHRCGPVMKTQALGPPASLPPLPLLPSKGDNFFGNQTLIFYGNMNFFATFLWAKFRENGPPLIGNSIYCNQPGPPTPKTDLPTDLLYFILSVPQFIVIFCPGWHLFWLQSRLCQCDGRVFIRAAACGIPLLAARISRDNYPLGPPPPCFHLCLSHAIVRGI